MDTTYLFLLFALDSFGISLSMPIYATYILKLGGTAFTVGLISSSAALISLLGNPIIGSLSDSNGRRSLLVKCLVGTVLGNILYAVAPTWHFVLLGKITAAIGTSIGILQKSILADVAESEDATKKFLEKTMLTQGIMMMTVSGLAAYLTEFQYGFTLVYSIAALAYLLAIVIVLTKVPDDTKKIQNKEKASLVKTSVREIKLVFENLKAINWPLYWDMFAMRACSDLGFFFFMTNLGIFTVQEHNLTGSKSGLFFMSVAICFVFGNVLKMQLSKIYPKRNEYSTIMWCCIFLALSYFIISLSQSLSVLFLAIFILAVSNVFIAGTYNDMITDRTNKHNRGSIISNFDNLVLFAQFVAPFVSGVLSLFVSLRVLLRLAAVPALISALVALSKVKASQEKTSSEKVK